MYFDTNSKSPAFAAGWFSGQSVVYWQQKPHKEAIGMKRVRRDEILSALMNRKKEENHR